MGKQPIYPLEVSYSNKYTLNFILILIPHILTYSTYFSPIQKTKTQNQHKLDSSLI